MGTETATHKVQVNSQVFSLKHYIHDGFFGTLDHNTWALGPSGPGSAVSLSDSLAASTASLEACGACQPWLRRGTPKVQVLNT